MRRSNIWIAYYVFALGTALVVSAVFGTGWLNPATVAATAATLWIALVSGRGNQTSMVALANVPLFVSAYLYQEAAEGRGGSPRLALAWISVFAGWQLFVLLRHRGLWPTFTVFLLVLLALFSARTGGAGTMVPWFAHWLPANLVEPVVIGVRKCVHSTFYPLLAFAALRSLETAGKPRLAAIPGALGYAAIFATFDEVRQSTVPGRTGSAWDVLLDLTAASLLMAFLTWREKRQVRKPAGEVS